MSIPQRRGDPIVVSQDEGVRGDTTAESLGQAAPGVQQGRHDHRRLVVADLRRRRRGRGDEQGQGRGAGPRVARRDRRARHGRRPGLDAADAARQRHAPRPARRRASSPPTSTWSSSTRRSPPSASPRRRELGLPDEKVNVNGGAIALGHPVGMSGTRVVLHLALELKRRGGGVGAAALCGGGGQGDALIVQGSLCLSSGPSRSTTSSTRARDGEARAVARLVSLVEDESPRLREVMAALAPYAGHAQVVGPHRLARRRQVDGDQRAGHRAARGRQAGRRAGRRPVLAVLRRRAARRPGADAATTRSTTASTSARWPPAATSAGSPGRRRRRCGCSTPPAATWCSSRPSASARARSRSPALADTTVVLLAPGMGDGIQAAKAGILEIGDVYVVNKADRDGADQVRRDLRSMIALGERGRAMAGSRRSSPTVAQRRRGHRRAGRRRSSGTAPGWSPPDELERAPGPPGPRRDRGASRSPRCALAGATCTAAPTSTTLAAEVVGRRDRPVHRRGPLLERSAADALESLREHRLAARSSRSAWVTDDIDATERLLSEQFGVGAWTRIPDVEFGPDTTTLRGEPVSFTAHISLGYAGDLQLELIEPVSGQTIHARVPRRARSRAAPHLLRGRRRRRRLRARPPRRPGSRC